MSILDIFKKIKSSDHQTKVFFLVIIGVGISAFGLGRMSMSGGQNMLNKEITMEYAQDSSERALETDFKAYNTNSLLSKEQKIQSQRGYVASKNGKLYYTAGCSGAKRIKPANEVWFDNASEAEKLGYTRSSSC